MKKQLIFLIAIIVMGCSKEETALEPIQITYQVNGTARINTISYTDTDGGSRTDKALRVKDVQLPFEQIEKRYSEELVSIILDIDFRELDKLESIIILEDDIIVSEQYEIPQYQDIDGSTSVSLIYYR